MTDQLSTAAVQFLEARGLDVELAVNLGLRSERTAGGGNILVFPFKRAGQVINHKRRELPKQRMWQDTGAPKAAWNEDCLRDDSLLGQPLIIVEGELDAVAAIQAGFLRTISVPDGAPPPAGDGAPRTKDQVEGAAKYAWLRELHPLLTRDRVPFIVLAVDNDTNGSTLQHELAVQLGRERCKYVTYPKLRAPAEDGRERCKDLNEALFEHGVRAVQETVGRSQFFAVEGLFLMSELPTPPELPVWDLPDEYRLLGENMRYRPGDVSVVTGIPSYGKSTFANALWCALIAKYGLVVTWGSFEQRPKPDHQWALRRWFWNHDDPAAIGDLRAADAWIDRYHRFIKIPEDKDASLDRILDMAMASVVQHGSNVLVIDPWNELEHIRDSHISLTEYIKDALIKVRRFAQAFNMHVMILAHPTKAVQGQDGAYRRPRMFDISDSSMWFNKADLGIIVHRPNERETQIVVEKSRYHHLLGRPGEVFCHFLPASLRYRELGRTSMEA